MHMKKLFLLIATVALFAPASIFAQDAPKVTITEDENTKTIALSPRSGKKRLRRLKSVSDTTSIRSVITTFTAFCTILNER